MSQKQANAMALLALTTGAGIVIGTNVDIGGIYVGSAATTVTIIANGTTAMQSAVSIDFYPPLAVNGPVTATSSGGSFFLGYRNR